jgi:hypothetical protein
MIQSQVQHELDSQSNNNENKQKITLQHAESHKRDATEGHVPVGSRTSRTKHGGEGSTMPSRRRITRVALTVAAQKRTVWRRRRRGRRSPAVVAISRSIGLETGRDEKYESSERHNPSEATKSR